MLQLCAPPAAEADEPEPSEPEPSEPEPREPEPAEGGADAAPDQVCTLAGWQVILRAVALPTADASRHGWSPRLGRAGGADGIAAGSRESVPGDVSAADGEDAGEDDEDELSAEAAS